MTPQDHIDRLERRLEEAHFAKQRLLELFEEIAPGRYALEVEYDDGDGVRIVTGFLSVDQNAVVEEAYAEGVEDDDEDQD